MLLLIYNNLLFIHSVYILVRKGNDDWIKDRIFTRLIIFFINFNYKYIIS